MVSFLLHILLKNDAHSRRHFGLSKVSFKNDVREYFYLDIYLSLYI